MSVDARPSHEDLTETPHRLTVFDSTEVMSAIDVDTAVITAVPPAKFFEPIIPVTTVPDQGDRSGTAEAELVIYDCGTTVPGYVHDPCQHSTVQVLCCRCAGCMFDLWSCGQQGQPDSWFWWEAQQMGARWDPWVRHPYAMVLYALLTIFAFVSHIVSELIYILVVVVALMGAVVLYGLHAAFT